MFNHGDGTSVPPRLMSEESLLELTDVQDTSCWSRALIAAGSKMAGAAAWVLVEIFPG